MPKPPPADLTEFCTRKRIDSESFRAKRPEEWALLATEFDVLGPAGFDSRKKFLINEWRLLFPPSEAE